MNLCVSVCTVEFIFFFEKLVMSRNLSQQISASAPTVKACVLVLLGAHLKTHHANHYAVPYSCQCADATALGPALCPQQEEQNKVHTVFLSLEDIISRWVAVAVNSSQLPSTPPPPPALSGGKSTDFLCLNGLAKDNFYMRKREKKIHFIFFHSFFCAWFVQPLQNGSSVIVLCSWEMIWILCRPEWEWEKTILGLSVCVWSETRDFTASSVFMWITGVAMLPLLLYLLNLAALCLWPRYSSFLVFKKKKHNQPTNHLSPARVYVCCVNVCKCIYFFL